MADKEEKTTQDAENTSNKDSKSKLNKKKKQSKADESAEKLIELGEKLAEINDKHLRLQAEFDNYRKRTLNEKMELMKSGGEDVLISLLPVLDNFERAISASIKTDDISSVREGINLIYNGFKDYLNKKGVKEIDAVGNAFDTDFHEALTKIPAPSDEFKGKVVDVIEKGYTFNEKVIRYAKVVVGE
ncbi:MAG: nucleotide exchange factor GrpE [Bacteroidales bacterium]|nr:nucleotide exchange factor GrpE [Bacteroidales bacterium]